MSKFLSKAIVAIAGCVLIGVAICVTKSVWWIFGLFFVAMMMEEVQ
jgi:hypothetical protein